MERSVPRLTRRLGLCMPLDALLPATPAWGPPPPPRARRPCSRAPSRPFRTPLGRRLGSSSEGSPRAPPHGQAAEWGAQAAGRGAHPLPLTMMYSPINPSLRSNELPVAAAEGLPRAGQMKGSDESGARDGRVQGPSRPELTEKVYLAK